MTINDYTKIFTESFFLQDYEIYKVKIEEYKIFLENELLKNPKNVKAASQLASVYMELRMPTKSSIKVIEDLIKKHSKFLTDYEKSELYTNLAYYYLEETANLKKGIRLLKKAKNLLSNFPETYYALAIAYADENSSRHININKKPDYKTSLPLFKKAFNLKLNLKNEEKYKYNYAVCLFHNNKTESALNIFSDLTETYNKLYYPSLYACRFVKFI